MLDIFNNDAFSVVSLTEAMNVLPYASTRLAQLNLFKEEGVPTTSVGIEVKNGSLSLIPFAPRGTVKEAAKRDMRTVRNLTIPHIPKDDGVSADEVQGLRSFGSDDALEAVSTVVNNKLQELKQDHEYTHEWLRACALRGLVVDADTSTTVMNIFTEFGVSETNINFPMATANAVSAAARNAVRTLNIAMGSLVYTKVRAICSQTFFEALVTSTDVKAAYERWMDGQFLRTNQVEAGGFEYQGIIFEEYNVSAGATPFIPAGTARLIAEGSPGLFRRYNAPADFVETVNTPGKAYYAKQEARRFNKGIDIHTQSNPLFVCRRPQALIKLTAT